MPEWAKTVLFAIPGGMVGVLWALWCDRHREQIDSWWERRFDRLEDWSEGRRVRKQYAGVRYEDLSESDKFFWPDIRRHLKR